MTDELELDGSSTDLESLTTLCANCLYHLFYFNIYMVYRWLCCGTYQYLDEMVKGPFKRWTRLHIFHSINDQKQTEILDGDQF